MNKRLAILIAGFFTEGGLSHKRPPATPTAAAAPAKPDAKADAAKAKEEKGRCDPKSQG